MAASQMRGQNEQRQQPANHSSDNAETDPLLSTDTKLYDRRDAFG